MSWVREFYDKQHEWTGVYDGEVEPHHRTQAASIILSHRDPPYRILELGCGGGQLAAARADLGHSVTAIDLNPAAIRNAHRLADVRPDSRIALIEGDFYTVDLTDPFDVVCYFDGFGIGSDADQRRLLKRIALWMTEDGAAFIEVYAPWYWARLAGTIMRWRDVTRQYEFDEDGQRMLDTWWPTGNHAAAVTQSLRCYAPHELEQLLADTDLSIVSVVPGGAFDPKTQRFCEQVPLPEAMQYVTVI